MRVYYLESSALLKRYVQETGSDEVEVVIRDSDNVVYISHIAGVEVIAAITRRGRGAHLDSERIEENIRRFREDFTLRFRVLEVTPLVLNLAMDLAERHGLRGYDAVQLATTLDVQSVLQNEGFPSLTLISADDELNTVAVREGVEVANPSRPDSA